MKYQSFDYLMNYHKKIVRENCKRWQDLKVSPERDRVYLKSRYILVYQTAVNELEVETPDNATLRVFQELLIYTNRAMCTLAIGTYKCG